MFMQMRDGAFLRSRPDSFWLGQTGAIRRRLLQLFRLALVVIAEFAQGLLCQAVMDQPGLRTEQPGELKQFVFARHENF